MHPRQNNISCQSRPFKARNSIKNSWVRQTKKRRRFCCIWPSSNNIFYFTLKTDLVNGRKRCPWVGQSISKTVSFSSAVRLIVVFRSLRPICTANNIASEPLTNINACFWKPIAFIVVIGSKTRRDNKLCIYIQKRAWWRILLTVRFIRESFRGSWSRYIVFIVLVKD